MKDKNASENYRGIHISINNAPEVIVPEGVDVDKVIDALANLPFYLTI